MSCRGARAPPAGRGRTRSQAEQHLHHIQQPGVKEEDGEARRRPDVSRSRRTAPTPEPLKKKQHHTDNNFPSCAKMWQPASERLQHFQTMLKTKLNVLTLTRKEPLPTVIFHEPEAIELCSTTTTPVAKIRSHTGYKVNYLGKVTISGSQFLSGCTEGAVVGLVEHRALAQKQGTCPKGSSVLEIRPFQVRLHHLDENVEASSNMDTYQVARIAYCTADHSVRPNVFAWIYREINDDLSFQMDCHAVECENKLEAKRLAHSMMEAFRKTFHSMRSDGRIHKSGSTDDFAEDSSTPEDTTPDDG